MSLVRGRRKQIWVGAKRLSSALDVFGRLSAVLFSPDDLNLVKGSPAGRRRYLDLQLSLVNKYYRHQLQKYNKVLAQRNLALKHGQLEQLELWDHQLVVIGTEIMQRRMEAVEQISRLAAAAQLSIAADEKLEIVYLPFFLRDQREYMIAHGAGKVPYTKDRIQGIFMNQLREKQWEERRQKSSLVGPQRDDLIFVLNGKDARVYASQGNGHGAGEQTMS